MKNRYPDLTKQVVFITGAVSGIDVAQAQAFLEQDAFVFGLDQRFGKMEELSFRFPETFAYALGGVRQRKELQQAAPRCQNRFDKVTILLGTAGILDAYKSLMEASKSLWDLIYETSVRSMYHLTNIILPDMTHRKSGTIINVTPIAGLAAGGGGVAYTGAKHAIVGFTKQFTLDCAEQGVRVKGIAPGVIRAPVNAVDFEGKGGTAEWVANETPVKRWTQPEEVAELTLFLISPQASYIQGTIIPIDGGRLLK